jgi:hypothetical protein
MANGRSAQLRGGRPSDVFTFHSMCFHFTVSTV